MKYPTYLIYATAEEVMAKLKEKQLDKQRKILKQCENLRIVEMNGDLMAAVDVEVYQFLVNFLRERTEANHNDSE